MTITSTVVESASLYFKAGSSDKIYNATIEKEDDKFVVNFSYGRRGSALRSGSKTSKPVSFDEARIIFNKIVKEKTSKGYKYLDDAVAKEIHVAENIAETPTESKCVLLNPITEEQVEKYINDPDWIAQQKVDGVRFMLHKKSDKITAYNRRGLYANIPTDLWNDVKSHKDDFLIDGELIGDIFYVFDILEHNGKDLRDTSFCERDNILMNWVLSTKSKNIEYTETHYSKENKIEFYNKLINEKREGIVFKHKDAKYYVGRPASGGQYLKFKFYSTCSCVVKEINNKRSVGLGLYKGKKLVDAGNVTISINFDIPAVNDVVEIRYLYARKQSGALYQPVYLGKRTDITHEECQQSQLKYKDNDE
jgi:bifunctional non-homologous end joining protein LigD